MRNRRTTLALVALAMTWGGCKQQPQTAEAPAGLSPRDFADGIHDVLSADREVYTKQVVNRLQNEEKVLKAGEHWKDEKLLPLPAQMFRMGAERVREKTKGFSYALLSLWPINKQNAPRTDVEKAGLEAVAKDPTGRHYADETIDGVQYLTAVYADKAVSEACANCHNGHDDSPRKDFKLDDVMGAVVIRVVKK
jgi:hypothetical protein